MLSCTPCRAQRNAVAARSFGSAVSDDVSLDVWMHSTPRSRTTSCTANAPDDASESTRISQPSLLTSSRATRAASCGWPFESRTTNSILRPARPPVALMRSISICAALRWDVPSRAIGPDRMVCIPTRTVPDFGVSCARKMAGVASTAVAPSITRRRPTLFSVIFDRSLRRLVFGPGSFIRQVAGAEASLRSADHHRTPHRRQQVKMHRRRAWADRCAGPVRGPAQDGQAGSQPDAITRAWS